MKQTTEETYLAGRHLLMCIETHTPEQIDIFQELVQ